MMAWNGASTFLAPSKATSSTRQIVPTTFALNCLTNEHVAAIVPEKKTKMIDDNGQVL